MPVHGYHPEMGEKISEEITTHATLAHNGKYYFLRTTIGPGTAIKGRGVEYLGQLTAERLVPGSKFVGLHEYQVTCLAYDKLKKTLDIGYEMLLD